MDSFRFFLNYFFEFKLSDFRIFVNSVFQCFYDGRFVTHELTALCLFLISLNLLLMFHKCSGFHRPLGVIPPSSSPPSYRHAPGPWSDTPPQYQVDLFTFSSLFFMFIYVFKDTISSKSDICVFYNRFFINFQDTGYQLFPGYRTLKNNFQDSGLL